MTTLDLFTDFADAATSDELACPLTKKLDTLVAETKRRLAEASRCSEEVERSLPACGDIISAFDKWSDADVSRFLREVVLELKEGRALDFDEQLVHEALYGPHYFDRHEHRNRPVEDILKVWDSRKVISARDNQFGNLEEAEKRQLFCRVADRLRRARHNDQDNPRQLVFSLYLFRDESYEKGVYRASWNGDRLETFVNFQRLIQNIVSKIPLARCASTVPLILNERGPFASSDLFRWHTFEVTGIRRFRIYKDGGVVFDLDSEEIKQEFLRAVDIYTGNIQASPT